MDDDGLIGLDEYLLLSQAIGGVLAQQMKEAFPAWIVTGTGHWIRPKLTPPSWSSSPATTRTPRATGSTDRSDRLSHLYPRS
ncbi:hypothetical protein [Streptomyces erythrochromogenes]|uniref:hypothetical protein n=1 Tax=Streptomyces erythrochromogenes TaxID=285574 RepID=UPI0037F8ECB9